MTPENIKAKICEIIAEEKSLKLELVVEKADLEKDLGCDSLDRLTILFRIRKALKNDDFTAEVVATNVGDLFQLALKDRN